MNTIAWYYLALSYIARIIPSQCFCFSTKARVPAKVTVEIVKYHFTNKRVIECEFWDDLYIDEDDDHFYVNDSEIKTISKEIEEEKKNKLNIQRLKSKKKKTKSKSEDYKNLNEYFEKIKSKENSSDSKLNKNVIDDIKEVKKDNEVCLLEYNEENNPFGKKWSDICVEIKEKSPFRKFESYSVLII